MTCTVTSVPIVDVITGFQITNWFDKLQTPPPLVAEICQKNLEQMYS